MSSVKFAGFSFQLLAAKILTLFKFFHSVFRFSISLLFTEGRSKHEDCYLGSVGCWCRVRVCLDDSVEKSPLKERRNLKDATVGEVAAALKLLAREHPHQSFLQNDLEDFLGH